MEMNLPQTAVFLDEILKCDSQVDYERKLVELGSQMGRKAELSLDEGEKWLRRRAIRRTDYKRITAIYRSGTRDLLPWSFVDLKILDWAKDPGAESKKTPDAAYLAMLLNRTVTEVEEKILERQNIRNGIRGFDL